MAEDSRTLGREGQVGYKKEEFPLLCILILINFLSHFSNQLADQLIIHSVYQSYFNTIYNTVHTGMDISGKQSWAVDNGGESQ